MIFITVKFKVRLEDADRWPQISAAFPCPMSWMGRPTRKKS